jgi:hypothetical protein
MTDYTLDAAARRCNDPLRVFSTAGYADGFIDPADKAAAIAALQDSYDLPYRMWHRSPAPSIEAHESLSAYQRRLPQGLARFSNTWSRQDFSRLDDKSLAAVSSMLIADVVNKFKQPYGKRPVVGATFPKKDRWYTTRDQAGREVKHFCMADEDTAWLPFTREVALDGTYLGPARGGFDFTKGIGINGPEARAIRAQEDGRIQAGLRLLDAARAASAG